MRKFIYLMFLILLITSCKSLNYAQNDDVYYSPKKVSATEQTTDTIKNNNYVTNEQFNYDNYYDYEYSTRIKRFHNSYLGYDYYNSYYTNSYWYTYK